MNVAHSFCGYKSKFCKVKIIYLKVYKRPQRRYIQCNIQPRVNLGGGSAMVSHYKLIGTYKFASNGYTWSK